MRQGAYVEILSTWEVKFGEHERSLRGPAKSNSSLLSTLQLPKSSISQHTHN